MVDDFYWRHARDNILTEQSVQMFQLLAAHEGEDLNVAKGKIDAEYKEITGSSSDKKHGGLVGTWVQAFREAGWVELEAQPPNAELIRITPAGKQALLLLSKVPGFLKVVPFFVVELLSRYQLNNPGRPKEAKNREYDNVLKDSDVFPYWTLFKIMRECGNKITKEELARFVFRIKRAEEIPKVTQQIRQFRADLQAGLTSEELNRKYPPELTGTFAETKYIMGRLGTHVGDNPSVVQKEGASTWKINPAYLPFIDEVLANQPTYQEHLSEKSWMTAYGRPVDISAHASAVKDASLEQTEYTVLENDLPDDDEIWKQVKGLIDSGSVGVVLSGPPGTSKSWYARRVAAKLVDGDGSRVDFIQFHPSYSYDDFIEGYVPNSKGSGTFEVKPKLFLRLCLRARANPERLHVLVIDELNRGDPIRAFGELLTYIERDYRDQNVVLAYSGQRVAVPRNVFVLATMNPYDKSVIDLDDALERRFDRIALDPSVAILKKLLATAGMQEALVGKVIQFFVMANKKSPHGIGHAFFVGMKDEATLRRLWSHRLRFIFDKMFRFEPQALKEVSEAYQAIYTPDSASMPNSPENASPA